MSAEIVDLADGILTVKITGKLTYPEQIALQKQAVERLQGQGKARILVIAEEFQGWDRAGNWGDISFQAKYDPLIERMAIVGEKRWEDLTLIFTSKGFRKFPIEYFAPADLAKARSWVAGSHET